LTTIPSFLERLPVSQRAWAYADEMHRGQTRKWDGEPFVLHPREVAALLQEADCRDEVITAGLLHDTIEKSPATPDELRRRFGADVADLVAAVTEDDTIASYRSRKEALRRRATESGDAAAMVFAADKISKVRQYRAQLKRFDGGAEPPRPRRLHHYAESLRMLERAIPGHPLVLQLRQELASLDAPRTAAPAA
jgi:(p)ppGpp synthase/HD superfamily hydrolase